MTNCLNFKNDDSGRSQEDIMYWQPTRLEGLKCSRGINCDSGICDECRRTHHQKGEDDSFENEKADDSSLNNNFN